MLEDKGSDDGVRPFQECAAHAVVGDDEGLGSKQRTFSPQVLHHSRRQRLCRFTATYQ